MLVLSLAVSPSFPIPKDIKTHLHQSINAELLSCTPLLLFDGEQDGVKWTIPATISSHNYYYYSYVCMCVRSLPIETRTKIFYSFVRVLGCNYAGFNEAIWTDDMEGIDVERVWEQESTEEEDINCIIKMKALALAHQNRWFGKVLMNILKSLAKTTHTTTNLINSTWSKRNWIMILLIN